MIISSKITKAIELCCELHKDQTRKATNIPYASHPISVGFILFSAGYSEEVIIAGILHDILEDVPNAEKTITDIFGKHIVYLIKGVTEDTSIKLISIKSWTDKKDNYLKNLKTVENDIKAISAADGLDNCRSIIRLIKNKVNIWDAFNVSYKKIIENYKQRLFIVKESLQDEITKEFELAILELENLSTH